MKKVIFTTVVLAIALCMCFVFVGCDGFTSLLKGNDNATPTASADTYMVIDINPTVEVVVGDGVVTDVKAGNDDGSILLSGEEFVGLSVFEAAKKVVALAEQMGFLTEGNYQVKITVVSDEQTTAQEILVSAQQGAEQGSDIAEVNSDPRLQDKQTVEELQAENPELYANLTPEKLRLIETIMDYDDTMTYEEGAKMSITDLAKRISQVIRDYADMVCDEIEDKFEEKYENAQNEIERKIAEVYGEEFLAKWTAFKKLDTLVDQIEVIAENQTLSDEDVSVVMAILGIEDQTLLQDRNGLITADSVEHYFDSHRFHFNNGHHFGNPFDYGFGNWGKHEWKHGGWDCDYEDDDDDLDCEDEDDDNDWEENDDDKWYDGNYTPEDIEDAIESILEKYEEEAYLLTAEQLATISEILGAETTLVTFEDLEDYVDTLERELKMMVLKTPLTEEQLAKIEEYKLELQQLKKEIKNQMKEEIGNAKDYIADKKNEYMHGHK